MSIRSAVSCLVTVAAMTVAGVLIVPTAAGAGTPAISEVQLPHVGAGHGVHGDCGFCGLIK